MRIVSWNVMLRKYEELYNPSSKILTTFEDEEIRLKQICKLICNYIDDDTVFCLQECCKKLLTSLQTKLFYHDCFYEEININDYLVCIVPKKFNFIFMGKEEEIKHGCISCENIKMKIVNCHLIPQNYSEDNVLNKINNLRREDKIVIIAGDFNEKYSIIKRLKNWIVPRFGMTYKNKQIDHIILSKKVDYTSCLLSDGDNLIVSDHYPVEIYSKFL